MPNTANSCYSCGATHQQYEPKCKQCGKPILKVSTDVPKKKFKLSNDLKVILGVTVFTMVILSLVYLLPTQTKEASKDTDNAEMVADSRIDTKNPSIGMQNTSSSPTYHAYIQRALIGNVYSVIGNFRMPITEYYGVMGKLPRNAKALKEELGEDLEYSDEYIKRLSIPNDGILQVELTERFGKDKTISFIPTVAKGKWGILNWSCVSNLPQKHLGAKSLVCKSTL